MKGTKTSNSLSCFKAGSIERFCSIRVFFVKSSTSERSMTELNRTHSNIKHSIFFNSNIFCLFDLVQWPREPYRPHVFRSRELENERSM